MNRNYLALNKEFFVIFVGKADSVQEFSDKVRASLLRDVDADFYTIVYELEEASISEEVSELKFYDVFLDDDGNMTDKRLLSYTLFVYDITEIDFGEVK